MAPSLAFLCLIGIGLVGLATFTPWPFPVAVFLIGAEVAAVAALGTGDAFLAVSAMLAVCALLFLSQSAHETFSTLADARRRPRRRRRRLRPEAELPPAEPLPRRDGRRAA